MEKNNEHLCYFTSTIIHQLLTKHFKHKQLKATGISRKKRKTINYQLIINKILLCFPYLKVIRIDDHGK